MANGPAANIWLSYLLHFYGALHARAYIFFFKCCLQCHAAHPTLMATPGKNIVLDDKAQIVQHAQQIYQQAVIQKTMPLANMTHITDQEREVIGAWFTAGAKAQ